MSGWDCDGCHQLIDADGACGCAEREADRDELYGPICPACGGAADDGYENCEFAGSGVYQPGPGDKSAFGCPRMTGTF